MDDNGQALISRVYNFCCSENLLDTDILIVGVSGGPDSMALITILSELADRTETFPRLYAVHVNHGIRAEDAFSDQKLVEDYCNHLDIPVRTFFFDVPSLAATEGKSLEEMGRILRYRTFDEVAREVCGEGYMECSRIAVAHHMGDITETMLMNLFRGSGLDGLVSPRSISGRIIRPLLCAHKEELIEFLDNRKIRYALDYTNAENDCTRNYWRNVLLPQIGKVSVKNPEDALGSTYSLLKDDSDFIDCFADDVYERSRVNYDGYVVFPCSVLRDQHRAISSRIVRRLRADNFGNIVNFAAVHTDKVLKMVNDTMWEFLTIDMPFDTVAFVMSGYLGFADNVEKLALISNKISEDMNLITVPQSFSCEIHIDITCRTVNTTKIPNSDIQLSTQIIENIDGLEYNEQSWFIPLYDDDIAGITVQNGLTHMKFTRAGSSSGKQLGRMMSDMHIPKLSRDAVVGVSCDDKLWIPGIGHSYGFVSEKSHQAWAVNSPAADRYLKVTFVLRGNNG